MILFGRHIRMHSYEKFTCRKKLKPCFMWSFVCVLCGRRHVAVSRIDFLPFSSDSYLVRVSSATVVYLDHCNVLWKISRLFEIFYTPRNISYFTRSIWPSYKIFTLRCCISNKDVLIFTKVYFFKINENVYIKKRRTIYNRPIL